MVQHVVYSFAEHDTSAPYTITNHGTGSTTYDGVGLTGAYPGTDHDDYASRNSHGTWGPLDTTARIKQPNATYNINQNVHSWQFAFYQNGDSADATYAHLWDKAYGAYTVQLHQVSGGWWVEVYRATASSGNAYWTAQTTDIETGSNYYVQVSANMPTNPQSAAVGNVHIHIAKDGGAPVHQTLGFARIGSDTTWRDDTDTNNHCIIGNSPATGYNHNAYYWIIREDTTALNWDSAGDWGTDSTLWGTPVTGCTISYPAWPVIGTTIINQGTAGTSYNGTAAFFDETSLPSGYNTWLFSGATDKITVPKGTATNLGAGGNTAVTWEYIIDWDIAASATDPVIFDSDSYWIQLSDSDRSISVNGICTNAEFQMWKTPTNSVQPYRWLHIQIAWDMTSISNAPVIMINGVVKTLSSSLPGTGSFVTDSANNKVLCNSITSAYNMAGYLVLYNFHVVKKSNADMLTNYNAWRESYYRADCAVEYDFSENATAQTNDGYGGATYNGVADAASQGNASGGAHKWLFDDNAHYIYTPQGTDINNQSLLSWEFVLYYNSDTPANGVLWDKSSSGHSYFQIFADTTNHRLGVARVGTTTTNYNMWYTPANSFTAAGFYHVVVTWDMSAYTLVAPYKPHIYINNVDQTLTSASSGTRPTAWWADTAVNAYIGNMLGATYRLNSDWYLYRIHQGELSAGDVDYSYTTENWRYAAVDITVAMPVRACSADDVAVSSVNKDQTITMPVRGSTADDVATLATQLTQQITMSVRSATANYVATSPTQLTQQITMPVRNATADDVATATTQLTQQIAMPVRNATADDVAVTSTYLTQQLTMSVRGATADDVALTRTALDQLIVMPIRNATADEVAATVLNTVAMPVRNTTADDVAMSSGVTTVLPVRNATADDVTLSSTNLDQSITMPVRNATADEVSVSTSVTISMPVRGCTADDVALTPSISITMPVRAATADDVGMASGITMAMTVRSATADDVATAATQLTQQITMPVRNATADEVGATANLAVVLPVRSATADDVAISATQLSQQITMPVRNATADDVATGIGIGVVMPVRNATADDTSLTSTKLDQVISMPIRAATADDVAISPTTLSSTITMSVRNATADEVAILPTTLSSTITMPVRDAAANDVAPSISITIVMPVRDCTADDVALATGVTATMPVRTATADDVSLSSTNLDQTLSMSVRGATADDVSLSPTTLSQQITMPVRNSTADEVAVSPTTLSSTITMPVRDAAADDVAVSSTTLSQQIAMSVRNAVADDVSLSSTNLDQTLSMPVRNATADEVTVSTVNTVLMPVRDAAADEVGVTAVNTVAMPVRNTTADDVATSPTNLSSTITMPVRDATADNVALSPTTLSQQVSMPVRDASADDIALSSTNLTQQISMPVRDATADDVAMSQVGLAQQIAMSVRNATADDASLSSTYLDQLISMPVRSATADEVPLSVSVTVVMPVRDCSADDVAMATSIDIVMPVRAATADDTALSPTQLSQLVTMPVRSATADDIALAPTTLSQQVAMSVRDAAADDVSMATGIAVVMSVRDCNADDTALTPAIAVAMPVRSSTADDVATDVTQLTQLIAMPVRSATADDVTLSPSQLSQQITMPVRGSTAADVSPALNISFAQTVGTLSITSDEVLPTPAISMPVVATTIANTAVDVAGTTTTKVSRADSIVPTFGAALANTASDTFGTTQTYVSKSDSATPALTTLSNSATDIFGTTQPVTKVSVGLTATALATTASFVQPVIQNVVNITVATLSNTSNNATVVSITSGVSTTASTLSNTAAPIQSSPTISSTITLTPTQSSSSVFIQPTVVVLVPLMVSTLVCAASDSAGTTATKVSRSDAIIPTIVTAANTSVYIAQEVTSGTLITVASISVMASDVSNTYVSKADTIIPAVTTLGATSTDVSGTTQSYPVISKVTTLSTLSNTTTDTAGTTLTNVSRADSLVPALATVASTSIEIQPVPVISNARTLTTVSATAAVIQTVPAEGVAVSTSTLGTQAASVVPSLVVSASRTTSTLSNTTSCIQSSITAGAALSVSTFSNQADRVAAMVSRADSEVPPVTSLSVSTVPVVPTPITDMAVTAVTTGAVADVVPPVTVGEEDVYLTVGTIQASADTAPLQTVGAGVRARLQTIGNQSTDTFETQQTYVSLTDTNVIATTISQTVTLLQPSVTVISARNVYIGLNPVRSSSNNASQYVTRVTQCDVNIPPLSTLALSSDYITITHEIEINPVLPTLFGDASEVQSYVSQADCIIGISTLSNHSQPIRLQIGIREWFNVERFAGLFREPVNKIGDVILQERVCISGAIEHPRHVSAALKEYYRGFVGVYALEESIGATVQQGSIRTPVAITDFVGHITTGIPDYYNRLSVKGRGTTKIGTVYSVLRYLVQGSLPQPFKLATTNEETTIRKEISRMEKGQRITPDPKANPRMPASVTQAVHRFTITVLDKEEQINAEVEGDKRRVSSVYEWDNVDKES